MSTPHDTHHGTHAETKDYIELPEEGNDMALLRAENAELRARLLELEQALQAETPLQDAWVQQQKEYEALLEEKSEVIRALHLKIQESQQTPGKTAGQPASHDSSMDDVKKDIEEERRQLERDEESVMQQMRQMELAMAKDRADLARQRTEIQRLYKELNHEIETAARDPELRGRLDALQRLHDEMTTKREAIASGHSSSGKAPGFLGRIFGR